MKESHLLALVVAYYLSRFDRVAYEDMGFATITDAHHQIGRLWKLEVSEVDHWVRAGRQGKEE